MLMVTTAGLLLVACGGGGPRIVAKDLAMIMPSSSDAPAGTEIDAENVGPKTLDDFVTDTKVKIKLRNLGFRVSYVVAFATRNYTPDAPAPLGSALYATFAVLLRDGKAAEEGFDYYTDRLRTRAKDLAPIVMQGLGDEVFAFRFSALDDTPLPGLAILWRNGNALFSIVGVGNPSPDPAVTRALASTIDRRAEAAG
jgi:hypothetical protein